MVCEYATFGSLAAWLGRVPHKHLGMVARGVAEALSATHRAGLVHSDVKPSNVLLCRCGPKLCDFGLNGTTFQYAAPEKLTKPDDEIPASDVWSLGMTILVAQIGKYPSTHSTCDDFWNALEVYESKNRIEKMCGEDLGSLRDDLYDFLDKCLAHDPRRRPTPTSLSAHAFCSSSCDDWKRPFASQSRGEDLLDSFLAKYDESSIEAERIHSLAQGLDMSISAVRSAIEKNGKIVVIERNRRRPYCCFRS